MASYTALLDANVLYSAPIRDLLLELAFANLYRARWSEDIQNEWVHSLLKNRPELELASLKRTIELMSLAVPDAVISGYGSLINSLVLPDPDDRHVLAAAILGRCDVIVTQNRKDFPDDALSPYGVETQHPDDFLANHLDLVPGPFCNAVRRIRARLKNPAYSIESYLSLLTREGLVSTATTLQQYTQLL